MSTPCRSVNWSNTQGLLRPRSSLSLSLPLYRLLSNELAYSPSVRCSLYLVSTVVSHLWKRNSYTEFVHPHHHHSSSAVQIPWWFGAVVKDERRTFSRKNRKSVRNQNYPCFQMETSNRNFLSRSQEEKQGSDFHRKSKAQRKACGKRLVKTQFLFPAIPADVPHSFFFFFFTVQDSDFYTHGDDVLKCLCCISPNPAKPTTDWEDGFSRIYTKDCV